MILKINSTNWASLDNTGKIGFSAGDSTSNPYNLIQIFAESNSGSPRIRIFIKNTGSIMNFYYDITDTNSISEIIVEINLDNLTASIYFNNNTASVDLNSSAQIHAIRLFGQNMNTSSYVLIDYLKFIKLK